MDPARFRWLISRMHRHQYLPRTDSPAVRDPPQTEPSRSEHANEPVVPQARSSGSCRDITRCPWWDGFRTLSSRVLLRNSWSTGLGPSCRGTYRAVDLFWSDRNLIGNVVPSGEPRIGRTVIDGRESSEDTQSPPVLRIDSQCSGDALRRISGGPPTWVPSVVRVASGG